MAVSLYARNCELLRAAYTAMDQTYGNIVVGDSLHSIDNANNGDKPPRQQPFETPSGYVVKAVIDSPAEAGGFGGKFVVYKNEATNTMLVNAMGTNGNSDAMGWYANATSYGIDQWEKDKVRSRVFDAMAKAGIDSDTQIVFNGDSKGGMLAQIMAYDFVTERNKGEQGDFFRNIDLRGFLSVTNDQLAVVAHSSAGIADYLRRQYGDGFDPTWSAFQGISVDYTAFRDSRTGRVDLVSMIGGDTLNGFGRIRYLENNAIEAPGLFGGFVPWAHRLTESGWSYLGLNGGDLGAAPLTQRQTLDASEMATIGSYCAGGGPGMSNVEAYARLGASLTCGLAFSPAAAAVSVWKDGWTAEATVGTTVAAVPPAQVLFLELTAASLTAANIANAVGDLMPETPLTRDITLAIGESAREIADFGSNLFGSTELAFDLLRSNLGKELVALNPELHTALLSAAENANNLMTTASESWAEFQASMNAAGRSAGDAYIRFALGLSNDLSMVPTAAIDALNSGAAALDTLQQTLEDAGNAAGRQFIGFAMGLSKWLDQTGNSITETLSIPIPVLRDAWQFSRETAPYLGSQFGLIGHDLVIDAATIEGYVSR